VDAVVKVRGLRITTDAPAALDTIRYAEAPGTSGSDLSGYAHPLGGWPAFPRAWPATAECPRLCQALTRQRRWPPINFCPDLRGRAARAALAVGVWKYPPTGHQSATSQITGSGFRIRRGVARETPDLPSQDQAALDLVEKRRGPWQRLIVACFAKSHPRQTFRANWAILPDGQRSSGLRAAGQKPPFSSAPFRTSGCWNQAP